MKFHPLSEIFPLMSEEELGMLVQDIKDRGQQNPAVVLDNMILDGRNRALACKKLGVQLKTTNFRNGISPFNFVVSQNLHRRHLTAGQKAAIVEEICTREQQKFGKRDKLQKRALYGRGDLADIFGKPMRVSKQSVGWARRIKNGSAETFMKLKAGKISLRQGLKEATKFAPKSNAEKLEFLKRIFEMGSKGFHWIGCFDPKDKMFRSVFFKDPSMKTDRVWLSCKSFSELDNAVNAMAGEAVANDQKAKVVA